MELEKTLAKLYYRFVNQARLTPALSRKLTGMARDRILEYGTADWKTTYGLGVEGLSKFITEGVNVLNADPSTRHYVEDDPFVREYLRESPRPAPARPPPARPRATSSPAILRPLPSLLAPVPEEEDGAAPPAPPVLTKEQRKAQKKERMNYAREVAKREREIAEATQTGRPAPAPLPAPRPPSPPPAPAPAPKTKPKKEKKKAKKGETAPAVDPEMALLDAEIAEKERQLTPEAQDEAQTNELARLRAEALAGNADAAESLRRILAFVSQANKEQEEEQEAYWGDYNDALVRHRERLDASKAQRRGKK